MSIFHNTPVLKYKIGHKTINVKREDLCCSEGSPRFAKIRGLEAYLRKLKERNIVTVGVLDSVHSKAGWGTAWLCKQMNMKCILYYPSRKHHPDVMSESQVQAKGLGATLLPVPAGRQTILWYQVRKLLARDYPNSSMLPNGLTLNECAEATYYECFNTPDKFFGGTVVISVSTGTIARGVAQYLKQYHPKTKMIIHMGYDRSKKTVEKIVDYHNIEIINEGYEYKDRSNVECPFPCNPYYDLKAWEWLLKTDLGCLKSPILFWNIGA